MPLRFVHAADLHVDSPLVGLERYEGAPVEAVRSATRRALENLIELCLAESVPLLLLAGDLFDGDWRDYSTGLFFASQMARLAAAGTTVVLVRGNHDAASRITRGIRLPAHVHELSVRAPETLELADLGVALHGQGFAQRSVTADLAASFPPPVPGLFNVGLLHTSLDGRPGHDAYAPTTVDVLRSKGYDYWALGHVHAREVVCRSPLIVFPGNLQGRHARETGPKGATLVSVAESGQVTAEPRALDVVRWQRVQVGLADCRDRDEAVEAVSAALQRASAAADGRLLCARVVLSGTTAAHAALGAERERLESDVRAAAHELGADSVWIEKLELRTRAPIDRAALGRRSDPIGRLVRSLDRLAADPAAALELAAELEDLRRKLPLEAREGPDGLRLDDPALLRELLEEVGASVLPRLIEGAES